MTEKRFTIDKDGITVIDNYTDGLTECKYSQEAKLLCNFLNEITEENEQLKSDRLEWIKSQEELECLSEYKQSVNDVLDSYYQKELSPIEEMLIGAIARKLNMDLHYKYEGDDVNA